MLKRNGCVYTQVVKHCSAKELQSIIKEFSELTESEIYSDSWKAYDGLVDFGAKAQDLVKHSANEFANGRNHINGNCECFLFRAMHSQLQVKGALRSLDLPNFVA